MCIRDSINTQPKAIQDKIKNIYIEIKNLDNINDEVEFEKHDNPNQYLSLIHIYFVVFNLFIFPPHFRHILL